MRTMLRIALSTLLLLTVHSQCMAQGGLAGSGDTPEHWSADYQHLTNVTVTPVYDFAGGLRAVDAEVAGTTRMTDDPNFEKAILKASLGDQRTYLQVIESSVEGAGTHLLSDTKRFRVPAPDGMAVGMPEIWVALDFFNKEHGVPQSMPGRVHNEDDLFKSHYDSSSIMPQATSLLVEEDRFAVQGQSGDDFQNVWFRAYYENNTDEAQKLTVFYLNLDNDWVPFNDTLNNPMTAPADSTGLRFTEKYMAADQLFDAGVHFNLLEFKVMMWTDTQPNPNGGGGGGLGGQDR